MASNRGYTTATKVRDVLAGQLNSYLTDAMIDSMINRIEGVIDSKLKIGTSASSFTWATGKSPHWAIEGAATYGAALQCCGPSAVSWNTLDQLSNTQNLFAYLYKFFMDIIDSDEFGDFV